MAFDFQAYMIAAEAALNTHVWTTIATPSVYIGAQDGIEVAGPICIVAMGDERSELGITAGNLSITDKPLLIMGAIPWTGQSRAECRQQELQRAAMRAELEETLKEARGLGGVTQLKIMSIKPSYETLNGPNGNQRYLCITFAVMGLVYTR